MNDLEKALLGNNEELEAYLANVSTGEFRDDVKDIKRKSLILSEIKKNLIDLIQKY